MRHSYAADGQIAVMEEVGYETPITWRFAFDSLGRQTGSVQYIPSGPLMQTMYGYNNNNQLVRSQWQMGETYYGETYSYNASDGRLTSVYHATGNTSTYSYDYLRRLSSIASGIHTRTYSSYRYRCATGNVFEVGNSVIDAIMVFCVAIATFAQKTAREQLSKADNKYINLLSQNYRDDYDKTKTGDEQVDLYLRLLMVADYISGMTDTYARTIYRELIGVE